VFFSSGVGLSVVTRIDMVCRLDAGNHLLVKKYAWLGIIMQSQYALVGGLLVYFSKDYIVRTLSDVPKMQEYLQFMVPVAALTIIPNTLFAG
jgi:Na+-driven multidrug efflux pump